MILRQKTINQYIICLDQKTILTDGMLAYWNNARMGLAFYISAVRDKLPAVIVLNRNIIL